MLYNIDPNLWGEYYWGVIHYITIAYPDNPTEDDKLHVKNFYNQLQHLLPCENCSYHYKLNLEKYPLTDDILSSRYKLIKLFVDIHNEVNRRTGKSEMGVEQVIEYYTTKKTSYNWNTIATLALMIFLIVLLIYYTRS